MMNSPNNYSENYFWEKIKNFAFQAGKEVIERALMLYYAAQRPETPLWAKTVIYSALAYFILPTDAIPDVMPLAGYADDLSALATALTTVAMCITPEVKQSARQKVEEWFGGEQPSATSSTSEGVREIPIE